jgi:thiol-disulfide isomerase/thioredoxin
VRVVPFAARFAAGLLVLAGCRLPDSTSGDRAGGGKGGGGSGGGSGAFWEERPERTGGDLTSGPRRGGPPDSEVRGVLAGQVIDSSGRRVPEAAIRVAATQPEPGAAPVEMLADKQGYFLIPGLQPGLTYTLTARSKNDGQLVAGEAQARPPYTRMVIRVSADGAAGVAPPPPGPSTLPDRTAPPPAKSTDPLTTPSGGARPSEDRSWVPGRNPAPGERDRPRPAEIAPPGPAGGPSPSSIAGDGRDGRLPPRATIPPAAIRSPTPPPPPTPPVEAGPRGDLGAPGSDGSFASITGGRVDNFGATDPKGRPWEFRSDLRDGTRLVLVDFWGTWCQPCLRAIDSIKRLDRTYGRYGLEVVGVACEKAETPAVRNRKVADIQQTMQINYTLLVTSFEESPIRRTFRVNQFPTLVLLDRDGRILWQGTAAEMQKLSDLIGQRLGAPR